MTAPTTTRAQGDEMKPYYDEDGITIYCGDCREVLPHLAASSVDATIADPPYGTTACAWDSVIPFDDMWRELKRLNKPNAATVLFGAQPFSSALVMSNPEMFRYEWIWEKNRTGKFAQAPYRPLEVDERILVFSHGTCTKNSRIRMRYNPQGTKSAHIIHNDRKGRSEHRPNRKDRGLYVQSITNYPRTVLRIASEFETQHPTQKPEELMCYLIATYTNPGDLVLDFTMGSGTTLRAAKDLGRRAIGIEIDEGYCEIAARRLSQNVLALEAL